MSDHTPGPWEIESKFGREDTRGNWLLAGGGYIALACKLSSPSEEDANARLIAAAPDLLATLKVLVACEGGAWDVRRYARDRAEALEAARAVIAKATGEQR